MTPSLTYQFEVQAIDINGVGDLSPSASFLSCVNPSGMAVPYLIASDATTYTIGWNLPANNGGCNIIGYALYSDNGSGGSISNSVDGGSLATSYNVFEYTATMTVAHTGLSFRVKVEAINSFGSTLSPAFQFVLASVPAQPTPAPSLDPTYSNGT